MGIKSQPFKINECQFLQEKEILNEYAMNDNWLHLDSYHQRAREAPQNQEAFKFHQQNQPQGWDGERFGAWPDGGMSVLMVPKITSRNKSSKSLSV